jgi:hypothetical protein
MQLLQILAIAACSVLIVFIIEAIRRNRLNVRYAILWLGSASALLALSIHRPLLDWVARRLGVSYPPSLLFMVAFLFLLSIVLHYSLVISSHRESIRRLTQSIALLQRALEEEREARQMKGAGG